MANKNIQMKQKNGTGWDELFPKTKSIIVAMNDGRTLEAAITDLINTLTGKVTLADVTTEIQKVVGTAPAALDTLNELANALNNDPSFATTITNALANKVDKVSGKQLSTEDFTTALKTKLDSLVNYTHPTTDGSLHVPATGTTNNGKVLKAGSTAGSASWSTLTSSDIGAVPTTDVVTAATASKILKLDANSKLPASITGNADGNSASATKLQTARTIALTGDVTGSVSFDGSANVSITTAYKTSGVTAGTYRTVTVDAKGNVTAGTNPTTLSGHGITDAYTKTEIDTKTANVPKVIVSATDPGVANADFWYQEV